MITIREAAPADVGAIQEVHRDSILHVANAFYSPEILAVWSGHLGTPDHIQKHEHAVRDGTEHTLVAESGGKIVGFGAIIPATSELRSLYVGSSAIRSGVGSKILLALEDLARRLGLKELHMDASISAERFYRTHGYRALERKKHRFNNGAEMDCLGMSKLL